eukprot:1994841-Rhodomonas_salina.2
MSSPSPRHETTCATGTFIANPTLTRTEIPTASLPAHNMYLPLAADINYLHAGTTVRMAYNTRHTTPASVLHIPRYWLLLDPTHTPPRLHCVPAAETFS